MRVCVYMVCTHLFSTWTKPRPKPKPQRNPQGTTKVTPPKPRPKPRPKPNSQVTPIPSPKPKPEPNLRRKPKPSTKKKLQYLTPTISTSLYKTLTQKYHQRKNAFLRNYKSSSRNVSRRIKDTNKELDLVSDEAHNKKNILNLNLTLSSKLRRQENAARIR